MTHSRLKATRLEHGWSQKRLAHELGTTEKTISRWERGEQNPSLYFREQLKTLLGLTWQGPDRNADQKHTSAQPSLQVLRLERGWSQQRLAHELGVSRKTISRWEQGAIAPSLAHREQLRTTLGWTWNEPDESAEQASAAIQLSEAPLAAAPSPPLLWNVPARRNPFFTGREELLSHLHARLSHERTVVLTQSLALCGLGGIGKTQTALEYAHRHAQDYSAVLWIAGETLESMLASFSALAKVLALPEKDEIDLDKMVMAVVHWLSTSSNWLLIIDNVEDLALVNRFLPITHHGSLLFTTRLQSLGTMAHPLSVERMPVEEGIWLLLRRARRLTQEGNLDLTCPSKLASARAIVEALDGLPLAIDQAGAYLEETRCRLEEYLQLFQHAPMTLLDEREAYVDHPASVVRTFILVLEKIEHHIPAAAELLRVCAFLAPDAIPERLLIEGASQLGPLMEALAEDPVQYNAALKALLSYSLIQRHAGSRTLSIHRLVQVVIKEGMAEEERKHLASRILLAVEQVFPLAGPGTSVLWTREQREWSAQLYSHALLCVTWSERGGECSPQVPSLLLKMGFTQLDRVQYEEAEDLLQRALHLFEQQVGPEHPLVATGLNGLGSLCYFQGRYPEAEVFYQRALCIREQQLGPEHPLVATSLNGLGTLCYLQGRYPEAEPLYRRALRIREQQLGPEHPLVATALNNLANLYGEQGRYPEAEVFYQQALRIREQQLEPQHPTVAYSLNNLAIYIFRQEKYAEAEPLYQRALRIWEQQLEPQHPDVAYALDGLANLYFEQGKYGEAEPLYQRALRIREQQLGPEHPLVAIPLSGLAALCQAQGKEGEAERLYQRALHIREHTLRPCHPDTAEVLNSLGKLYLQQGRDSEAEPLLQRALVIVEQSVGPSHPLAGKILANLAHLKEKQESRPSRPSAIELVNTLTSGSSHRMRKEV